MVIQKLLIFLKRDFIYETSYKSAYIFEYIASLFPVFSYYYISKLIRADTASPFLEMYGVDYFSFVIIGIALSQYLLLALNVFARQMRRAQWIGSLEAMINTRTHVAQIILFSPIFNFINKASHLVLVVLVGSLFFSIDLSNINIVSTLIFLLITILFFCSLGIFSASIIILLKNGDPFEWLFGMLVTLLGGAYFPIDFLPSWLMVLAKLNPLTYSFRAIRLSIFKNSTLMELWQELVILTLSTAVLLPFSVLVFCWAVRMSKRKGSLLEY